MIDSILTIISSIFAFIYVLLIDLMGVMIWLIIPGLTLATLVLILALIYRLFRAPKD